MIDVAVLTAAYLLSYVVRFEGNIAVGYTTRLFATLPYVVALQYVSMLVAGVPRIAWRYFGLRDLMRVVVGLAQPLPVLVLVRVITVRISAHPGASFAAIPYSVILLDGTFALLGLIGVRVLRRMAAERIHTDTPAAPERDVPTLLVGAGRAGVLVAQEMLRAPQLGLFPVGFLDDDPVKVGTTIHGIPVLGTAADLPRECQRRGAKQVLITIANASGSDIRRITASCEEAGVAVRIIPGLSDIVGGRINLSRIRDVAIEDLLRRDPVELEETAITASIRGRTVLVTGAGGSIGSELCRQVARFEPNCLVLLDHGENSLFFVERELRTSFPDLTLVPRVADITDEHRLDALFREHRPDVLLHAAAHKHVPLMEANPTEAVKNNVFGTKTLADLADRHGVEEFVMISTDKAVNPTSVMGVSKRAAEIYIQALSQRSRTRFVAVRFGNVLGSAGSVVPIFREQIARGGPVTVTHPEMKRYFMTIPEAAQLVLQAGALGKGGEIFVLDMGEPVRVFDLAKDMIRLSGLKPGDDIEIVFTGMRPGEKLFEELSTADEHVDRTRHPKIFVGRIKPHAWEEQLSLILELRDAARKSDESAIRGLFKRLVPEYGVQPRAAPPSQHAVEAARPSRPSVEGRVLPSFATER